MLLASSSEYGVRITKDLRMSRACICKAAYILQNSCETNMVDILLLKGVLFLHFTILSLKVVISCAVTNNL